QPEIGDKARTIYPDPQRVTNARGIALAAHNLLGVNGDGLYPSLVDRKRRFVYIQRFADPAKAAAFLKKGFAGVLDYPEERRTYPQDATAAQVVGYAGVDNKGLGGLELEYDHKLSGHPGKQTIV